MLKYFIIFVAAAGTDVAQVKLESTLPGSQATYTLVLPLPDGGHALIGTTAVLNPINSGSTTTLRMVFNSLGSTTFVPPEPYGGHGNDIPRAAAVDPSGNVWIVGDTDSDDFTLMNPVVSQKVPYRTAGFVMEFDPKAGKLLFATYLGGHQSGGVAPPLYASHATAITIGTDGSAFVGGDTDETDFPTTPGAFLSGKGGADAFYNTQFYSYVLKVSPAGKLVYSTLLGTGTSQCVGGSRCIGNMSTFETVSSLAVEAGGTVTAAGIAGGSWNPGAGYVARVAADGTKLLWTLAVPTGFGGVSRMLMAEDSSGNVDLFGQYVTIVIVDPGVGPITGTSGLFAGRVKSDGSGLVFLTDLGQASDVAAAGVVLDSAGNAWMAGTSSSPQFPVLAGVPNLGADFVLRLDASGTAAQTLFRFPHGTITAPPAMESSGNLLLVEAQSALLTFPANYAFDSPAIVGFANGASCALNTGIYPGTLLTLYGFDLPASPQVSLNGVPAPVLFASSSQINAQVPFGTATAAPDVTIEVTAPSGATSVTAYRAASVGIFTTDGVHAAALNQDGSVNSASNPVAPGSIVSLFGTGAAWPAGTATSTPAASAVSLDQGANGFGVVTGTIPLNVLYFGAAPGIIEGVFQMNVQLPQTASSEVFLQIRSVYFGNSNVVRLYVM